MHKPTALLALALSLSSAQAAKLTVWTHFNGPELAWLKDVAGKYSAQEQQDAVEIINVPFGDIKQKLILGAPRGEGADLVLSLPHDQLGEMAAAGVLEPMDRYVGARGDINRTALSAMTYQGKLFGLPMFAEAVAVVYNKKLIQKVPSDWAGFLAAATRLTDEKKGTYGYLANLGDVYAQYGVISAYGGYVFKNNGGTLDVRDLGVGNAGVAKAMGFLNDLRYKYKLVPEGVDGGGAKSAFVDGRLAMLLTGPWDMGDIKKAGIDYGIAAFPTPPGATGKWSPFVGVQGVLMNSYSKNKAAAARFARFIISPDSQVAFNRAGGRIPISAAAVAQLRNDVVVSGFSKNIAAGVPMPNVPQMGAVWGPWTSAIVLSTGKPSPDYLSILSGATQEIKANIK
ncbi:maltose ABC transporter substrate-binding protein [Deinococcus koreensis]|uniref:Maltose ABC transporter substrate-binding protein n=1 Tax=Deinococcus koreensis TaxID=2054903 RepID=A0A2K3USY3_9DEIO|nr:maltose ABC transporter substrate-binding protein [Deinococcus koreensis]PNY79645.1 maltose ABC transporter substrate-binding protein [Deinococcus koreensis]